MAARKVKKKAAKKKATKKQAAKKATKKAAKKATAKKVTAKKQAKKAAYKRKQPAGEHCISGVCDPQRKQGLVTEVQAGDHVLVALDGPGLFLGAQVSKQGGDSGLTFVDLTIDGRNVTNLSFAAADNWGLTQQNPYGLVLLGSAIKTLTIGWPTPLRFAERLVLSVKVNEPGVVQILGNVIHGAA